MASMQGQPTLSPPKAVNWIQNSALLNNYVITYCIVNNSGLKSWQVKAFQFILKSKTLRAPYSDGRGCVWSAALQICKRSHCGNIFSLTSRSNTHINLWLLPNSLPCFSTIGHFKPTLNIPLSCGKQDSFPSKCQELLQNWNLHFLAHLVAKKISGHILKVVCSAFFQRVCADRSIASAAAHNLRLRLCHGTSDFHWPPWHFLPWDWSSQPALPTQLPNRWQVDPLQLPSGCNHGQWLGDPAAVSYLG